LTWGPPGGPDDALFCVRCGQRRVAHLRFCRLCGYEFEPAHASSPDASGSARPFVAPAIPQSVRGTAAPTTEAIAKPTQEKTLPIRNARRLPDGTTVRIEGALTISLGAVEAARGGFIQDPTGGIALYLDAPVAGTWPAGRQIAVSGSLGTRRAQRTLRIAETSIEEGSWVGLPVAVPIKTGAIGAAFEGVRIEVTGTISGRRKRVADGLAVIVDDGSGPVRVVIGPFALAGRSVQSGRVAVVAGPVGRRDRSGDGAGEYRINARLVGDLRLASASSTSAPVTLKQPVTRLSTLLQLGLPRPMAVPLTGATPIAVPAKSTDTSVSTPAARDMRAVTRSVIVLSAIAALALGAGDLMKTSGLFASVAMVVFLAHRELEWPETRGASWREMALLGAFLAVAWAIQLSSIPLPL
jgi:hypothetical protein